MADITWAVGDKIEFGDTNHSCTFSACCEIDTDKFVVVYRDLDDGNGGKARVGTRSGTVITWGTISEFYADVSTTKSLGVCKLDTDRFVVVYAGNGGDGFAIVGEVTTRTIAWGTGVEFETGDAEHLSCCLINTNKFAIAYKDETAGDLGTVCVCTVDDDPADNTVHPGTPVVFEGNISNISCAKLDTDKFLAFYRDSVNPKACAFSVSTTTPTAGTILEIEVAGGEGTKCCQLDTDKCALCYNDTTDDTGDVVIVTRDDDPDSDTLHAGTIANINPIKGWPYGTLYPGIAKLSDTEFAVSFEDYGNSEYGTSNLCSFSGTTITPSTKEIFSAAKVNYTDICLLSAGKVVVVYTDDADANDIGEAVIGEFAVAAPEDYPESCSVIIGVKPAADRELGVDRASAVIVGVLATASRAVAVIRNSAVKIGTLVSASTTAGRTIVSTVVIGVLASASRQFKAIRGQLAYTEILRPNASGDETNLTPYPAEDDNWECVNEAVDPDTTHVGKTGLGYLRDLYNLPASSNHGIINKITVYFRCGNSQSISSGYGAKASIKSGVTTADGDENNVITGWNTYSQQWATNPDDGEAWEWADIDDLQIGVSLKSVYEIHKCYCTQVYVEVSSATGMVMIGIATSATKSLGHTVASSVVMGVLASASRTIAIARVAATKIGIVVSAVKGWGRTIASSVVVGILITASKISGIVKSATVIVGIVVSAIRTSAMKRVSSVIVGIVTTASRVFGNVRLSAVIIGMAVSTTRAVAFARASKVLIGVTVSVIMSWITSRLSRIKALLISRRSRVTLLISKRSKAALLISERSRVTLILKGGNKDE